MGMGGFSATLVQPPQEQVNCDVLLLLPDQSALSAASPLMYPVWGREGAKSWIASGWIVWEEELISGEGGRGKVLPPPRPSLVWTAGARKRSAVGVRSEVRALLCFAVVVWWLAGWLLFPPPSPEKHGCLLSSLAPLFARQQAAGSRQQPSGGAVGAAAAPEA